jgi:hypothetical protein
VELAVEHPLVAGPGRGEPEDPPLAGQVAAGEPLQEAELDADAVAVIGHVGERAPGLLHVLGQAQDLHGRPAGADEPVAVQGQERLRVQRAERLLQRVPDVPVELSQQLAVGHVRSVSAPVDRGARDVESAS